VPLDDRNGSDRGAHQMKLSPLSIPYRVLERGGSILFTAAILYSGASAMAGPAGEMAGVALVGIAIVALVVYEVTYHRRFEYELGGDTLDIRSGVVSRRNREIPLGRIQNVDISRNVVQRVLGIAVVDFETAGGSETEASLRFVDFEEAKRLQGTVGRLKRGGDGDEATAAPEAEELFSLSGRELGLVAALAFDFRVPGVLFVVLTGGVPAVSSRLPTGGGTRLLVAGVVAVAALVALVSWLGGALAAFLNYYGFRLTRVGDELQYERGLLRRYDGSIPLDKIQTLTVLDDPLKRAAGYASLRIETAGYAPGGAGSGSEVAVPLARRKRVFDLADRIEPFETPTFERPPRRVRRRYAVRYLLALGGLSAFVAAMDAIVAPALSWPWPWPWYLPLVATPVALAFAHFTWRHRGHYAGDHHFITRNGFLRRRIKIVPYYRVQTVIDSRTLFQRRWGVATVTADTAGSLSLVGNDAAAVDVDTATADGLRDALDGRLRTALAARRGWIDDGKRNVEADGHLNTTTDASADADTDADSTRT
jgi:putative membrane protein